MNSKFSHNKNNVFLLEFLDKLNYDFEKSAIFYNSKKIYGIVNNVYENINEYEIIIPKSLSDILEECGFILFQKKLLSINSINYDKNKNYLHIKGIYTNYKFSDTISNINKEKMEIKIINDDDY